MLKIKIICVGGLKEKFFKDAAAEYIKRLKRFCRLEIVEIEESKKGLEVEGAEILKYTQGFVTALDRGGRQTDSEGLAALVRQWSAANSTLTFIIGGSHGLSDNIKKGADFSLSMGEMTFPHHLFRLMLLEQIYRAFMINAGSEYHK